MDKNVYKKKLWRWEILRKYVCGVGEVERARDTDCVGHPDVCHRNHTSLLAAVGLRSLCGWGGSSYFGRAQPDSRGCSSSASTSVSFSKGRCPTWTHGSSEGSAVAIPTLTQPPLSTWPLSLSCPCGRGHGQRLRQRMLKGWKMFNLYSRCQKGRKGHLALPFNHRQSQVPAVQGCGDTKYFLTKRNWITCLGEP